MQTVLINTFDRAVGKNIFTKGFLEVLQKENVRIIALVPATKLKDHEEWLSPYGITVVGRRFVPASMLENFAFFIARNSIPTHTVRQIQEESLDGSGRLPLPKYLLARFVWWVGHYQFFQRLLKRTLPLLFQSYFFDDVLREVKPDAVFATTMYSTDDIRLMRAARRHKLPLLGMVKSWDNLTSKENLVIPPDHLIVHNDIVHREAVVMHQYPPERISITGVPQFDAYIEEGFIEPRGSFFAGMGLDPAKKLILYSAMGSWLVRHERDFIKLLAEMTQSGELFYPSQLLVRLHPAYTSEDQELAHIPGIVLDRPGNSLFSEKNPWKADWKFTDTDVRHLASTLKWSNVAINSGSTMILDAVCFDTPIIGVAFDGEAVEPSYWRSARRLFEREHCKKAVASGGARVVKSREELRDTINSYLSNPSLDHEGRQRMIRDEIYRLDGHASERVGRVVADMLKQYEK